MAIAMTKSSPAFAAERTAFISTPLTMQRGGNWSRQILDNGGMAAAACAVSDLNGDGKPDIACIGSATANLKWYENRGASPDPRPSLAVVEKISGFLGFYAEDGKPICEVKLGIFPHEAVLSRDGRFLYVSDNGVLWMTEDAPGTNTISIVDVQAMKLVRTIDLGRFHRPHGISWDTTGTKLRVTTERPFGLVMLDAASGKILRDYDVDGKSPHMVTMGPDGHHAYVSNVDSGNVAAIDLGTGATKLLPTGARAKGLVFNSKGDRAYVVNSGAATISIIDPARFAVVGEIATGKGAGRLALTPDGKTLVYNLQQDHSVGFADIASAKEVAVIDLGGNPLSLTTTRDGKHAFAAVQDQDKVFVICVPDRKIERVIEKPKGAGPDPVIPLP